MTLRSKLLTSFDKLLSFTVPRSLRFPTHSPTVDRKKLFPSEELKQFSLQHSFFSSNHPLIGKWTPSRKDLETALPLIHSSSLDFHTAEYLAKVIAYRQLKIGDRLDPLPYRLEKIIDLWAGMPAFCFTAADPHPSLLLFRGTVFSILSVPGIASLISDFDPGGPGSSVFLKARAQLHAWLKKQKKTSLIGYSLGAAFAAYTFIYENEWVDHSWIFHPPGISPPAVKAFESLPKNRSSLLSIYIADGDPVSSFWRPLPMARHLTPPHPLPPIAAHTCLMTSLSPLTLD